MDEDTAEVHLRLLVNTPNPDGDILKRRARGLAPLCEPLLVDYMQTLRQTARVGLGGGAVVVDAQAMWRRYAGLPHSYDVPWVQ